MTLMSDTYQSDASYNYQSWNYDTYACVIKNLNEALNTREEHISNMESYITRLESHINRLESHITSLEHERDIVISENNDLYDRIKDMRRNKYKIKN